MSATLMIRDETAAGEPVHEFPLEFPSERITVRELIRERVYQEVSEYNYRSQREGGLFRGLVQPTDTERTLNGFRVPKDRDIDWEAQFARAIDAFGRNGFFILVDDRQHPRELREAHAARRRLSEVAVATSRATGVDLAVRSRTRLRNRRRAPGRITLGGRSVSRAR
jgi:hypothetical protein